MKRIEFLLLMALADGPAHGYALVTAIREARDGAIRLEPGNLYRRIHALAERGLVERAPDEDPGSRRRTYRLTRAGVEAFLDETDRLARLAREAGAVAARVGG